VKLSLLTVDATLAAVKFDLSGDIAKDPEIKEAIEARAFISKGVLAKLDQCFTSTKSQYN
jgi:hypothetical protein